MTYAPRSPSCPTKVSIQADSGKQHELRSTRTWILCTTLGALVVPGYALDQFLQRALVAHLLPLVHHARHDDRVRQSLSQGDCSQYPKLGEGGGAGEKRSLTYAGVEKRATGRTTVSNARGEEEKKEKQNTSPRNATQPRCPTVS